MPSQSCQKSKHKCKYFRAAIFKPIFWRSPGCHCFLMDKEGNCSCSLWLLFTFPQNWGSALAFWILILAFASVFSSAVVLGHAPYALPTAETPASFSQCLSPQWGLSGASRWQCHGQGEVPRGCFMPFLRWPVSLFCVVTWAPAPRCIPPAHWIISLQWAGTILEVQKMIFIVIDHISPSPVTHENLGIPRALYLALFNFAAI